MRRELASRSRGHARGLASMALDETNRGVPGQLLLFEYGWFRLTSQTPRGPSEYDRVSTRARACPSKRPSVAHEVDPEDHGPEVPLLDGIERPLLLNGRHG